MRKWNLLCFIFGVLFLVSCNKESAPDYLQTTGEIINVERDVADFTEIEIYHKINLFITQDTINHLRIEAGKNLIPDISTEVKNGKLIIKNTNKFNFLRSYNKEINVFVSCKNLTHLIYNGAGNISSTNTLNNSNFNFDCNKGTGTVELSVKANEGHFNFHTGQCDIILHGEIGLNYLYQAGNGYTNAEDLKTGYTFVTNKGTNDLKINVSHVLFAKIYYLGNIYYKGNPTEVGSEITDKGQLIKID